MDVNTQSIRVFVYKSVPSATRPDLHWLSRHNPLLIQFMPTLYLVVQDGPDQVSLSDDGGQDLSTLIKGCSRSDSVRLCTEAARLLAGLHATFHRANSTTPRSTEATDVMDGAPGYPISNVQDWAIEAAHSILRFVHQHGVPTTNGIPLTRMANTFYKAFAETLTEPVTLTHGDPHLGNFVQHSSVLRLVDWEYACAAPPERDLAVLLQSIPDAETRTAVCNTYKESISGITFGEAFTISSRVLNAALFDNTLMMLGWEIDQLERGPDSFALNDHSRRTLIDVAKWKLPLIYEAFAKLSLT